MAEISIIIPNYNRANFLSETIQSVLDQSYQNWECLVVDDGSNDNSYQVTDSYIKKDSRIKWIERNRLPKGAPTCRNIGAELSTGKYIIFLDSDDLLAPHCLDQRINIMENHLELDLGVFPMQIFNQGIEDATKIWNIETGEDYLKRFLSLDSVWQTSGPIWRRHAFEKTEGFNEKLSCWQDIDIHLRAFLSHLNIRTFYDLSIDCYYRSHQNNSISQGSINSVNKLQSRKDLYFWSLSQINDKKLAKPMALNIIVSAIKSLKIKFALRFLSRAKQRFSFQEVYVIVIYFLVFISRLYKVSFFQSYIHKQLIKLQPTVHVGKHIHA